MPRLRILLAASLALTAGCTGFRELRPGVFRAPQMHEDLLARKVGEHDIKTLVCLRGGRSCRSTARVAIGMETTFVSVPLSASRLPEPGKLLALWQIAATAERPLLLHCRAGVDRTGLASAIVTLHDTGDLAAAFDQLDLIPYGHVSIGPTAAMDTVLELYAPHATAGMAFPDWARNVYPGQRAELLGGS